MWLSEILGSDVVNAEGVRVGRVRDIRLRWVGDAPARHLGITGLVCADGGALTHAAHAWGFVEGRARGPWVLRAVLARIAHEPQFVPADRVTSWVDGQIVISGDADALPPLRDHVTR